MGRALLAQSSPLISEPERWAEVDRNGSSTSCPEFPFESFGSALPQELPYQPMEPVYSVLGLTG